MRKLYINDLMHELNYSDTRAVRKWCYNNGITIMKAGKAEFIYEASFTEVIERPFILKLKQKFGAEWESVYKLYSDGNIPALNTLHALPTNNKKALKTENSITTDYRNKFLDHARK